MGWHYNDLTAATASPLTTSPPTGYVFNAQGTQHVFYQGADNHIHELWWDSNGWHHHDLTAAAGAPLSMFRGNLFLSYVFEAQGTQHVIYQGLGAGDQFAATVTSTNSRGTAVGGIITT